MTGGGPHRVKKNSRRLWRRREAEREGFEPPVPLLTRRFSKPVQDLRICQLARELRQTQTAEVPTVVPTSPGAVLEPVFQPDLARVVAVWDRLPVAIRAGILALVETAVPQRA